jgi:hypothetical protein
MTLLILQPCRAHVTSLHVWFCDDLCKLKGIHGVMLVFVLSALSLIFIFHRMFSPQLTALNFMVVGWSSSQHFITSNFHSKFSDFWAHFSAPAPLRNEGMSDSVVGHETYFKLQ